MNNTKWTEIEKAAYDGKWMEFWFVGSEKRDYDESCKAYQFWDLVNRFNLQDHCLNNGVIGLRIKWEKYGSNYNPIEIKK